MKFYSELLDEKFDTIEELESAEKKLDEKNREIANLKEAVTKAREMYQESVNVMHQAEKAYAEALANYRKANGARFKASYTSKKNGEDPVHFETESLADWLSWLSDFKVSK